METPEVIGETHLKRERWDCDECRHEFEMGAAFFDPIKGIVCPKCSSHQIGPKRDQTIQ